MTDLHHHKNNATLQRFLYTVDQRGNRTQLQEISAGSGTTTQIWTHSSPQIEYRAGNWTVNGAFKVSPDHSAVLRFAFFGQTFSLTLGNGSDYGMCDIYVDDFYWGSRDLYSASATEETFSITCYTDTAHKVEIRTRLDKNPASSGRKLAFKQVEIQTQASVKTEQYAYDALSRVTSAKRYNGLDWTVTPAEQHSFTYDKSSNRTNGTAPFERNCHLE